MCERARERERERERERDRAREPIKEENQRGIDWQINKWLEKEVRERQINMGENESPTPYRAEGGAAPCASKRGG